MSGPTWVSCSPWAVQGCGCQDLRGCQAVNPLRPRSRARSPPAPRIHLDMGSVYPPKAWLFAASLPEESRLPHSWVPGVHDGSPRKRLEKLFS